MFGLFKKKPKEPTIPPEALAIMVHRRSYLEAWRTRQRGSDNEVAGIMATCEAFGFTPSLITQEGAIPVLSEHLEALQLSFEDAFRASVQNAGSYINQQRMASTEAGMIVLQTENGLAGSALALSGVLIDKLPLDGPVVAMLPEENHVLFAALNQSAALEEMLDTAEQLFAGAAEYRSLRVVCFSEDGLMQDWVPQPDHPMALRFRTAAATTRKLSAQETYSVSSDDSTVSLGHLSTSVRGALVGAWARDTSVIIPADLDRLVLVDTPESEHPLVDMDFGRALELLPYAFESVGLDDEGDGDGEEEESPPMYRTRSPAFPSARNLAFLAELAAYEESHPAATDTEVDGATLVRAWDDGEPVQFETLSVDQVTLRNTRREWATVEIDDMRSRIAALPAADRFNFANGQTAIDAMARMEEEGEAGFMEILVQAKAEADALVEQARHERPELLSSLVAQALIAEAAATEGSEAEKMDVLAHARQHEPTTLFPLLRPRGYAETNQRYMAAYLAAHGYADVNVELPTPIGDSIGAGFSFELVADSGESRNPLNDGGDDPQAREIRIRTARLNLRAASLQPLRPLADGRAYQAVWPDDYRASRLLVPDMFDDVSVVGERLLFAPTVSTLWVAGSDDHEGLSAVIDAVEQELADGPLAHGGYAWRELLSGLPFVVRHGELQVFVPTQDHPLAERLNQLDATARALQGESQAAFDKPAAT